MNQDRDWQVDTSSSTNFDPLLECLVVLTKLYYKPQSGQGLTAGLPMVHNKLTPELFLRAAERADFSAHLTKCNLSELSKTLLPAVILLKNQRACVITEIRPDGTAQIIQPETGLSPRDISLLDLAQDCTDTMIFVSPKYRFDTRAEAPGAPVQKRWFWGVIAKSWPIYSEVLIASFLINVFALASPLFIMNVYDRVVPNNSMSTLWVLATGILVVLIFDFIMRSLRGYFIDAAGKNIDVHLSQRIFKQLLGIEMGVRPGSVGSLVNSVQSFESFREFITSATITALIDLPFVFIFLIAIIFLGGTLVFVPIIAIPIVLLLGVMVQMPVNDLISQSYRHSAEKQAVLYEALSGIETIKGIQAEGPMQNRWETIINAASKISVKLRFLSTIGVNFSTFAQQAAVIVLVIVGVFSITAGHMTTGSLIACTILTTRSLVPITQIAGLLARYQQSKSSIQSLDKIMRLNVERPADKPFIHHARLEGDIEFRNVNFTYTDQPVSALQNISFHIKPREKVAIIGTTGSGKSTLQKLIMKLYEPTSGNILLDGHELHQIDPVDVRHSVGYVPQEMVLFHGSIKDNIIVSAPYVDDSALLRAATLSGVTSFVAHHPDGFQRQVGERGQHLSAGQRQAVCIARAILQDTPIWIFDELSNSMDDRTTAIIIEQLKPLLPQKTLIVVTHKAAILNLVDRIIVVDNGRIAADGPKEEILKKLSEPRVRV